jgi:transcription-repair coupling factor (superfamily II helicase)
MNNLPFLEAIRNGAKDISIGGLWGSSKAYLISLIRQEFQSPCLIVTPSQKQAEEVYEDLTFFCQHPFRPTPGPSQEGNSEVYLYSQWDIAPYEQASPHREIVSERLVVLDKLLNHENIIVIAPVEALMHRTLPRTALHEFTVYVGVGEEIDRQLLIATLVDVGYKHTALVENRGEFSIRGGIIDVFPAFSENPIRIELFGDTVESLREFDAMTQRSLGQLDLVNILPGRELILGDKTCAIAKKNIEIQVSETGSSYNALKTVMNHLDEKIFFPGFEWYAPYFHGELETLFDYINPNVLVFLDEPGEIESTARTFQTTIQKNYQTAQERGSLLPEPEMLYLSPDTLATRLHECQQIKLQWLDLRTPGLSESVLVKISCYAVPTKAIEWGYTIAPNEKGVEDLEQHLASTTKRIREWIEEEHQVVIVAYTEGQAKRLWEILRDHNVPARVETGNWELETGSSPLATRYSPLPHDAVVLVGTLNCGFIFSPHRLVVITEDEFLGKQTVRQRHKQRKPGKFLTTLGELEIGDYVVHVDHGIGIYQGLKKIAVRDIGMECLHLEYSGGDKLYVPVDRLDLVQKYKGADQRRPKIDKLGGTSWARVKERVKASVEKMAKELLETYAVRQALPGAQFSMDDHLYREFEASFEYEETPDQAKTIEAVIRDMMLPKPMDRLVCGDVGYGKTEIAMRAAFLAVLNGKQVAILVPTTLLAQQHYDNFVRRFASYPVNVGMLSRFKTKKEQQETVKRMKEGKVDIVIGTHRLLQKDIQFKDLGLVIIDEEQRFGVSHKEKLRQLRKLVDVLTLTATPIPRTLHISLMGVRDLSIIETPPEGRLAVRTYVTRFDENIIYEAITKEMERGGQIFFIHNRIETIDGIALRVSRIVPHARIAIAHGQLKEHELERIMFRFINQEIDVLISTTIVESGLDIPSVNTIIINRAHTFGLAELYQLRGRIGRSKTRAYAYLLVSDEQLLTSDAKKRLRVIQELSDLGSGFKLAAHDLEIRGAGNLLGAEQTGHIAALGFDLYCKIIEQTVREIKGQPLDEEFYPQIDLQVSAYFPEEYIPDMQQRLEMYKRLMSSKDFAQLFDVEEEIRDRYGKLPQEAQNIVALAELKLIATQLRITQIKAVNSTITLVFDATSSVTVTDQQIKHAVKQAQKRIRQISPQELTVELTKVQKNERISHIKDILLSFQ